MLAQRLFLISSMSLVVSKAKQFNATVVYRTAAAGKRINGRSGAQNAHFGIYDLRNYKSLN